MKAKEALMNKIKYCVITVSALLHQYLTYVSDKHIFTADPQTNLTDYVICKICAFIVSWFFFYLLWELFVSKDGFIRHGGRSLNTFSSVIVSALPYLFVMAAVSFIKLRSGYLSNDETLIYENAVNLVHYTWFYYITTYYYIISLMLIPHMYAPIFIKLIIEYLVIGYTLMRSGDYFRSRSSDPLIGKPLKIGYGFILILLFLMYPVIAYTTSAHRLPVYFLLYLYMTVMLIFDRLEHRALTVPGLVTLLILGPVLTQWRTEGIYLAVLIPILAFITYDRIKISDERTVRLKDRRIAVLFVLAFYISQYIISVPQNGIIARELGAAADDRMKPFYAYTITNMVRNGLDRNKNADDLAVVDRYISLDSIDAINDYYGDINYEDVLILYQPGFIGVREDAGVTEYYNFTAALKNIFRNNPNVFLRTRIGAFNYAALPYHITHEGSGIRALAGLAVSTVKTVSYNLYIPLFILMFILIYSLIRGRWFTFLLTGGLIAHWFIVFILAPASYFKYYFPVYITAYLYLFLLIAAGIYNRRHSEKIQILR